MAIKYIDRAYLVDEYSLPWAADTNTLSDVNLANKINKASREVNMISKGQIERDIASGKLVLDVVPATTTTDAIKYATALLTEALLLNDGNFNGGSYSQSSGGESYSGNDDGTNWVHALERASAALADVGLAGTFSIGSLGFTRTQALDIDEIPGSEKCLTRDQLYDNLVSGVKVVGGTLSFTEPGVPSKGLTLATGAAAVDLTPLATKAELSASQLAQDAANNGKYVAIAQPNAEGKVAQVVGGRIAMVDAPKTDISKLATTQLDNLAMPVAQAGKFLSVGQTGAIAYADAPQGGGTSTPTDLSNYPTKGDLTASQAPQDTKISALEASQTAQDTKITDLQTTQSAQDLQIAKGWITTSWVPTARNVAADNGPDITYRAGAWENDPVIDGYAVEKSVGTFFTTKKGLDRSGTGTIYRVRSGARLGQVIQLREIVSYGLLNGDLNGTGAGAVFGRKMYYNANINNYPYDENPSNLYVESMRFLPRNENDLRYWLRSETPGGGATDTSGLAKTDLSNITAAAKALFVPTNAGTANANKLLAYDGTGKATYIDKPANTDTTGFAKTDLTNVTAPAKLLMLQSYENGNRNNVWALSPYATAAAAAAVFLDSTYPFLSIVKNDKPLPNVVTIDGAGLLLDINSQAE